MKSLLRWVGLGVAAWVLSVFPSSSFAAELSEGNAAAWGTFASDGAAAKVSNDSSRVKVGSSSIKFETQSGFDTGVKHPAGPTARWDLTGKNYLVFWTYAVNNNDFQDAQPVVVLRCKGGTYRYTPGGTLTPNRVWRQYYVPLAGDSRWKRTQTGAPLLTDVNQIEIHQDTWEYGFTVYYDGVEFVTLDNLGGTPPAGPPPSPGVNPDAIIAKALLVIFDPILENRGNKRAHVQYGWTDPINLTQSVINDLKKNSHGLVSYKVEDVIVVDGYPYQNDGFRYDDETWVDAWENRRFDDHKGFDYKRFIEEYGIAPRIESGEIDEVWVYADPMTGMWESTMAGNGGYWCNSSPVQGVPSDRLFVVMGWNYERGVAEAIHSYGHRSESIMTHSYGDWTGNHNWRKFTRLDKDAPGQGGVGNIHYPVNAPSDYDYGNTKKVLSNADDWYHYPNFQGITRSINFREWSPSGADTQRDYINWWYHHLPHFPGKAPDQFLNNWWRYLVDVDQFKGWDGYLYYSNGAASVSLTSPVGEALLSGIVTVRANASANGALGRVDLYVDGAYHSTDTLAPYTFEWDTTGLSGSHTLLAKAYELQNWTEAVSAPLTVGVGTPTPPGNGMGLTATYFNNKDFTGNAVKRLDRTVNFNWGISPPVPSIARDTFSVRWEGQVEPQFTETYTFTVRADDGVRLWVDGKPVIDHWKDEEGVTESSGTVVLEVGKKVSIKLEYYKNWGGARAHLLWSSPSTPKAVLPRTQLYTPMGDVNLDGRMNVGDAVLVLRSAVGLESLTDDQQANGDLNGDAKVDVADAIIILQGVVGG